VAEPRTGWYSSTVAPTLARVLGRRIEPKRLLVGLIAFQVLDALVNAIPNRWIKADLERLKIPVGFRLLFAVIKGTSAGGLLVGLKAPAFGRLTSRALVAYFVVAIGAHARAKDRPWRYGPAVMMLGWSALAVRRYRDTPA
jgi:hypothetical protein